MPTRIQSSSMKSGAGTIAIMNAPASGTATPMRTRIHSSAPAETPASSSCLLCGTRPNSISVAQPNTICTRRPSWRPMNAMSGARTAMAAR